MRALTQEEWALWQLSVTEGIGPLTVRTLVEHFGSAVAVCQASRAELSNVTGIGMRLINALKAPSAQAALRDEYALLESLAKHSTPITPLFVGQEGYPEALAHCADAPISLYVKGTLPIGQPMIAIVGTRNATTYSEEALRVLIHRWAALRPDLVVVSGLAFGVDAAAHTIAMEEGLKTVAVVAHGHHTLYPSQHRHLAERIIEAGGAIVSEYQYYTKPLPQRFVSRNRIVAGMSLGTIVAESKEKGGALITATLAFEYGRGVYALPGRFFDATSSGCNQLIFNQKASIITSPDAILKDLNLIDEEDKRHGRPLPFETEDEDSDDPILQLLARHHELSLEDLTLRLGASVATLSAQLFELEMNDQIRALPGGRYALRHKH